MIRNNQNGRRRGRGGARPQGGGPSGNYGNSASRIDTRQRGNASQLLEKYKSMARDAAQNGDRVQAEFYMQYADHYFRVLNEFRARDPQPASRPSFDDDDAYGSPGDDEDDDRGNLAAERSGEGAGGDDWSRNDRQGQRDNGNRGGGSGDQRGGNGYAQPRGNDQRGNGYGDQRGAEQRGGEQRGGDQRGYDPRGGDQRNPRRANGDGRHDGRRDPDSAGFREPHRNGGDDGRDTPYQAGGGERRPMSSSGRDDDRPHDNSDRTGREDADRFVADGRRPEPVTESRPAIIGLPGPATIAGPAATEAPAAAADPGDDAPAPRRRGRPRKVVVADTVDG